MNPLIEIDGAALEYRLIGHGEQTVVILTGMGCSFEEWVPLATTHHDAYRFLLFHRPGFGTSERGNRSRRTETVIQECIALLDALRITTPILLVGHSYGGLCAQHLAKRYPGRIRGLVLVDSTSHDYWRLDEVDTPTLDALGSDEAWRNQCRTYGQMHENDLKQTIQAEWSVGQERLSDEIKGRLLAFYRNPLMYRTMLEEDANWADDARLIKRLGQIVCQLVVIGRDSEAMIRQGVQDGVPAPEMRAFEEMWHRLVREQVALSDSVVYVDAVSSGHHVHLDRPDLVIEALAHLTP